MVLEDVNVLSHEASTILHEELQNENVSDESRVLLMCRLLSIFLQEIDSKATGNRSLNVERSYKLLIPLMESCLKSSNVIETQKRDDASKMRLLDELWERLCLALTSMLSPVSGPTSMTIPHADDLVDLVRVMPRYTHPKHSSELCAILSGGALKCLEIAGEVSKGQEEILQLFTACFSGVCLIRPEEQALSIITLRVLKAVQDSISLNDDGSSKSNDVRKPFNLKACALVCQVLQEAHGIENVVIAVFPKLCEMVVIEDTHLRQSIGGVIAKVNVGKILRETQDRCEKAESSAKTAEKKVEDLLDKIEKLEKEKQALEQQLGFLG